MRGSLEYLMTHAPKWYTMLRESKASFQEGEKELKYAQAALVDKQEHTLVERERHVGKKLKTSAAEHVRQQADAVRTAAEAKVLLLTELTPTSAAEGALSSSSVRV